MKLMIFHPDGVSYAYVDDNATDEEIQRVTMLAATIEEGNGNGKVKMRDYLKNKE